MPASFTYPGVYVTEKESGARAVPAAATSIAMFVGMADIGPFETPTRVQSLAATVRLFGATSSGEMADQLRQFFVNGGGDAYVMRIAKGAQQASVDIQEETGGTAVLRIIARDVGMSGNQIRVLIDYATASPERTFNLTAYRSVQKADGSFERADSETHTALSMNPDDPRYVVSYLEANATLVRAEDLAVVGDAGGVSISGLVLRSGEANAQADVLDVVNNSGAQFRVRVNGRPAVTAFVDKGGILATNVLERLEDAIEDAYLAEQQVDIDGTITASVSAPGALSATARVLQIQSNEGPIEITPAGQDDLAVALMLGTGSGGIEMDQFSRIRPAPSGIGGRLGTTSNAASASWLNRLWTFATTARDQITFFSLADPGSSASPYSGAVALTGTATDDIYQGTVALPATALGALGNVRQALDEIAAAINLAAGQRWTASRQGMRLILLPVATIAPSNGVGVELTTDNSGGSGGGHDMGDTNRLLQRSTSANIGSYQLGTAASGGLQTGTVPGLDGSEPGLGEYQAAFATIASQVEIFNMLVLPRAEDQDDTDRQSIWGAASSFAAEQRAILFVDPGQDWNDIVKAEAGANSAKVGVDTRNSVIYWPKLKVAAPDAPKGRIVDPSGSMAGLYARTDTRFGTWRAPAGIEATLTGVLGTTVPMSDPENGRINLRALNAIRQFPSGITAWGARTMVGADDTGNLDDKYVNVRRMMLFIENSLYRALRFAVFKNNAEPLWASIRLAAGSFMNGLMTQGAFASTTKSEAYYVLCDSSTTTPTDVNLGIVNVVVGFAPNKPAEFVHLTVTQMAGQVEV